MHRRDLVLLGGGHTHVLLIKALAMRPIAGVRITLVSEKSLTPYSGMLPGFVAGHYSLE
ncbi:MAG: selenide,water dikinase, partial [Arenicella sp.]